MNDGLFVFILLLQREVRVTLCPSAHNLQLESCQAGQKEWICGADFTRQSAAAPRKQTAQVDGIQAVQQEKRKVAYTSSPHAR